MRRRPVENVGVQVSRAISVGTSNTPLIEDAGTTNGTSINGGPIDPGLSHPLEPGSTLRLGISNSSSVATETHRRTSPAAETRLR
jgi:pSer/pThr/pTyr-binding forkhead associated (FHA) protein